MQTLWWNTKDRLRRLNSLALGAQNGNAHSGRHIAKKWEVVSVYPHNMRKQMDALLATIWDRRFVRCERLEVDMIR